MDVGSGMCYSEGEETIDVINIEKIYIIIIIIYDYYARCRFGCVRALGGVCCVCVCVFINIVWMK